MDYLLFMKLEYIFILIRGLTVETENLGQRIRDLMINGFDTHKSEVKGNPRVTEAIPNNKWNTIVVILKCILGQGGCV
jgi:hypothetical protein